MTADTYPHWLFDSSPIEDTFGDGERAIRFLEAQRHPSTGRPIKLDYWQRRLVMRIYGPRYRSGPKMGQRIVKQVIAMIPRGNRKTGLGALFTLLHTCGPEKKPNGQALLAAYNRDQARIAFEEALGIIMSHPRMRRAHQIRDHRHMIVHRKSRSVLKAVSADAGAQNGRTPQFVLLDEIHAWKKRDLYDVMKSGLNKTPGSLLMVISQAGRGTNTVATEVFDYARKVALVLKEDPATLPVLFETARNVDWKDEALWHRANPGLALGYPDIDGLRQMVLEAEDRPAIRERFKNDHLNIWLDNLADPWIDMGIYDEGAIPVDLDEREGDEAWLAVDLGSVSDLTAVSLCFRDDDGGFSLVPFVFAPEATLRSREERGEARYAEWAKQGHLIATPGYTTDHDVVLDKVRELCGRFRVRAIGLDPWGAAPMINRLLEDGLPAVKHRQGFASMSVPMKAFENAAIGRKLRHGAHPVLRWCVENVQVDQDPAGNVKPNKRRTKEKIDAAVASIMALGLAENQAGDFSIYDDPSITSQDLVW